MTVMTDEKQSASTPQPRPTYEAFLSAAEKLYTKERDLAVRAVAICKTDLLEQKAFLQTVTNKNLSNRQNLRKVETLLIDPEKSSFTRLARHIGYFAEAAGIAQDEEFLRKEIGESFEALLQQREKTTSKVKTSEKIQLKILAQRWEKLAEQQYEPLLNEYFQLIQDWEQLFSTNQDMIKTLSPEQKQAFYTIFWQRLVLNKPLEQAQNCAKGADLVATRFYSVICDLYIRYNDLKTKATLINKPVKKADWLSALKDKLHLSKQKATQEDAAPTPETAPTTFKDTTNEHLKKIDALVLKIKDGAEKDTDTIKVIRSVTNDAPVRLKAMEANFLAANSAFAKSPNAGSRNLIYTLQVLLQETPRLDEEISRCQKNLQDAQDEAKNIREERELAQSQSKKYPDTRLKETSDRVKIQQEAFDHAIFAKDYAKRISKSVLSATANHADAFGENATEKEQFNQLREELQKTLEPESAAPKIEKKIEESVSAETTAPPHSTPSQTHSGSISTRTPAESMPTELKKSPLQNVIIIPDMPEADVDKSKIPQQDSPKKQSASNDHKHSPKRFNQSHLEAITQRQKMLSQQPRTATRVALEVQLSNMHNAGSQGILDLAAEENRVRFKERQALAELKASELIPYFENFESSAFTAKPDTSPKKREGKYKAPENKTHQTSSSDLNPTPPTETKEAARKDSKADAEGPEKTKQNILASLSFFNRPLERKSSLPDIASPEEADNLKRKQHMENMDAQNLLEALLLQPERSLLQPLLAEAKNADNGEEIQEVEEEEVEQIEVKKPPISRSDLREQSPSNKALLFRIFLWLSLGTMIACGTIMRLGAFNLTNFTGLSGEWLRLGGGLLPNLCLAVGIIGASILFYFETKARPKTDDFYDVYADIADINGAINEVITEENLDVWLENSSPEHQKNLLSSLIGAIHPQKEASKRVAGLEGLFILLDLYRDFLEKTYTQISQPEGEPLNDDQKAQLRDILNYFKTQLSITPPRPKPIYLEPFQRVFWGLATLAFITAAITTGIIGVTVLPVLLIAISAVISSIMLARTLSPERKKIFAKGGMFAGAGLATLGILAELNFFGLTNKIYMSLFTHNHQSSSKTALKMLNNGIAGGMLSFVALGIAAFGILASWLARPDLKSGYQNFQQFKEKKIQAAPKKQSRNVRVFAGILVSGISIPLIWAAAGTTGIALAVSSILFGIAVNLGFNYWPKPASQMALEQHRINRPGAPGRDHEARMHLLANHNQEYGPELQHEQDVQNDAAEGNNNSGRNSPVSVNI